MGNGKWELANEGEGEQNKQKGKERGRMIGDIGNEYKGREM